MLMQKTIAASWKLGSDQNGKNYFYNYVTGESRWTRPEGAKLRVADEWVKNTDEYGNVYYFNQISGESSWLPPCSSCSEQASKWCLDCLLSYCNTCYTDMHTSEEAEPAFKEHRWKGADADKEDLGPGEEFCLRCKRRKAKKMCTVCWDAYCDTCFISVHSTGALRNHPFLSHKQAKQGWLPIKGKTPDEPTYYYNGRTGEVTYDKPVGLMNETERELYERFVEHKEAAEKYVDESSALQLELEATKYERDKLWMSLAVDAGRGGGGGAGAGGSSAGAARRVDPLKAALDAEKGGVLSRLFGFGKANSEYRKKLLNPTERPRGAAQVAEINKLIDGPKK